MNDPLDEIDKHILYRLAQDARNTTAREIARELDVSPGTVGNRINRLESHGILKGYYADIDHGVAENFLQHLFICHAPIAEQKRLDQELSQTSSVMNCDG